jgi:NAD(P)H-flavin reductase
VVLLKGIAVLGILYEDFGLRPMSDVDLWVRRCDLGPFVETVEEILGHKFTRLEYVLEALTHRDRYRNVTLLYGARSPSDLLFADQLQEWRGRFDFEVLITVDHGDAVWRGPVGVVTSLITRASFDPGTAVAFVCGPEIMMRFTIQELERAGIADERLFVSMERNMKCGIGLCGHCQLGPFFVCKDGPVMSCESMSDVCWTREV